MHKQRYLVLFFLMILLGLLALPANAERLTQRTSRGNNIGMTVGVGWGMPWSGSDRPWQFPKGSGNFIFNNGGTMFISAAIDKNGDGVPEDTCGISSSRSMDNAYTSLEALDLITSIAQIEPDPSAVLRRADYNRVWSSLDPEELAAWPVEGRIPRTSDGVPDLAPVGETLFFHSSDVLYNTSIMYPGGYYGWTLRFLNFGESNNICYGHVYYRNMSEYMKYNPSSRWKPVGEASPNGWKFHGAVLIVNMMRNMGYGGDAADNAGWMYHPAKRLTGFYPDKGPIASFTPSQGPLVGFMMINPPRHGNDVADLTAFHAYGCKEFGYSGAKQIFVGSPWGATYRAALNLPQGMYTSLINPFNGRQIVGCYPGRLYPEDARYNQWIWGGNGNSQHYSCWGEVHDIAPRDTLNWDFAWMLVYPGVDPLVVPTYDIANIDNPMMQDAFKPLEYYANVADRVVNGAYQMPATPIAPTLTIIPGDREVTITWSDINLQTPDPYYAFLEEGGMNRNGYYKEFDFQGYRVYRSYVGPNDSHADLLADFNKTDGNVQFHYNDRLDDDKPYLRMRNGLKVWYAVVPYDKNYDPVTNEEFSLPALTSSKTWNRYGDDLYTVIPRSNASNFRAATLKSVNYMASAGTVIPGETAPLTGDGTGKLTEAPRILAPTIKALTFTPVNNEKITTDKSVTLVCTGASAYDLGDCTPGARMGGERTVELVEGSYHSQSVSMIGGGSDEQSYSFIGPVDNTGGSYTLDMTLGGLSHTSTLVPLYSHLDAGGYAGADIGLFASRECDEDGMPGAAPSNIAFTRSGQYKITWKDAGGGNLTAEVQDLVRGGSLSHVQFVDEYGWGFQPLEDFGGASLTEEDNVGNYIDEALVQKAPKAERNFKMREKLSSDRTDEFGFWIDGLCWVVRKEGGLTMPAAGTVWNVTTAFGYWNTDKTVFTQYPDLPQVGDKWQVEIKAMSMNPEDADFSRIKVVPNPYMASSYIDMSPSHRRIEFVNLPAECTIRIYTLSGNLVNVLNHIGSNRFGWGNYTDWDRLTKSEPAVYSGYDNHSGTEPWNLRNRFGQTVASGLYFYTVTDSRNKSFTGKFYVIN